MPHHSLVSPIRSGVIVASALVSLALAPVVCRAAVAEWIGGPTGNWNTASNWSGGVVPTNTPEVSYFATIAQEASQYTQVTMDLPLVQLEQLKLQPLAELRVTAGNVLRLRNSGVTTSGSALIGGGTLTLAGGRLESGGGSSAILRSADQIYLSNGGRIGGSGWFNNGCSVRGSGTIGNLPGETTPFVINNTGSTTVTSVESTADTAGQTLTLSPGGPSGSVGIRNYYATLGATNGGILVIRGNGTTLENTNGTISAASADAEVQFRSNTTIINNYGTLQGSGTFRIPAGESATITTSDVNVAGNISSGNVVVEGTLTLKNHASSGRIEVQSTLNADKLVSSGSVLLRAVTGPSFAPVIGSPTLNSPTSALTNTGLLEGGGTVIARSITNGGSIQATYAEVPLRLSVGGIAMGPTSSLRSTVAGSRLIVGEVGTSAKVTSTSSSATLDVAAGSFMEINAGVLMGSSSATVDGTLTLRGASNLGSITGSGDVVVEGSLSASTIRLRSLDVDGPVVMTGTDAVQLNALTIRDGDSLDLKNAPMILAYGTTSPIAPIHGYAAAGAITSSAGKTIGIAEASTIGSGTFLWNGTPVTAGSTLLVLPTLPGDTNLDRSVNFADLVKLAQNYNRTSGAVWTDGDSNYDGAVDFADLVKLAQSYNGTASLTNANVSASFAADWAMARSIVPEPVTLLLAGAALPMLKRRRR